MLNKLSKKLLFKLTQKGGYFFVKSGAQCLKLLLNAFKIKLRINPKNTVSFESQVEKYQLSHADLIKKETIFLRDSLIYLCLGVAVFFYGCYFLSSRQWYSCSLCYALTLLLFSLSFRAHFWSYQIKTRQLGASVKSWLCFVLKGDKAKDHVV